MLIIFNHVSHSVLAIKKMVSDGVQLTAVHYTVAIKPIKVCMWLKLECQPIIQQLLQVSY